MEKIMVKGINWVKGFALLGMMVALVGMLAVAPGASAASATTGPIPSSNPGKISVFAHQGSSLTGIGNATVVVREYNSDVIVLKGLTDRSGRFASYIPAGIYQVSVIADGYKPFSQEVKIAPAQGTSVTAALEASDPSPIDR